MRQALEDTALTGDPLYRPWENASTAVILDQFKGNSVCWDKVKTDLRVAAVIHKASKG